MAPSSADVLIADRPGPWRTAVSEQLRAQGRSVTETASGTVLLDALAGRGSAARLIVIGHELSELGGLEALYRSKGSGEQPTAATPGVPTWNDPKPAVLLVVETTSDDELLELLRRRGVSDFLSREAPLPETVEALSAVLADRRKVLARHSVRIDARIDLAQQSLVGSLYDINLLGARVVLPRQELKASPRVGESLSLQMKFRERTCECAALIRHVSNRKDLFGDHVLLGLQFAELTDDRRAELQTIIEVAAHELELARTG